MNEPRIEMRKLAELKPHPKNPRIHPESAVNKLAESIKGYGFNNPVQITNDGIVLAGHARCKAAAKAGLTELPCIVLDMTEDEALAYLVADNKVAEYSMWDADILVDLFKELQAHDFNMELTAFEDDAIVDLIAKQENREIIDDEFDIDAAQKQEPFTKAGDVWQLGRHTLIVDGSLEKLMQGNKANLAITVITKDIAISDIYAQLMDGGVFYAMYNAKDSLDVAKRIRDAGFHYSCTCTVKRKGKKQKGGYSESYLPIAYTFKNTAKHKWYSDRKQTTAWEFNTKGKYLPLELYAYAIQNHTAPNSIILDPNCEYGQALIVCEKKDRIFKGIASESTASVIIRRFQNASDEPITFIREGVEKEWK